MELLFNRLFQASICVILIVLAIMNAYFGYTKGNTTLLAFTGFYCIILIILLCSCIAPKNNQTRKDSSDNIYKDKILFERLKEFALAETLPPEIVAERSTFKDNGFCPYCKTEKMERHSKNTIIITNCKKCYRNFSNIGPIYTNGKIRIANFGEGFLKEMLPVSLENDILP